MRAIRPMACLVLVAAMVSGCDSAAQEPTALPGQSSPLPTLVGAPAAPPSTAAAGVPSPNVTGPTSPPPDPGGPALAPQVDSSGPPMEAEQDPDSLVWRSVALGFVKALSNKTVGYEQWLAGLEEWVSAPLLEALAYPQVQQQAPDYAVRDVTVVVAGDPQMQVLVVQGDERNSQLLTMVRQPQGAAHPWLVTAVSTPDR